MKKYVLTLGVSLLAYTASVFAQSYTDVFDYLESYKRERENNEEEAISNLIKAKDVIEKLSQDADKQGQSKLWKRRGDVYYYILKDNSVRLTLDKENAPEKALEGYSKALVVEKTEKGKPKIEEKDECLYRLQELGSIFAANAEENYNAKNFKKAYYWFEMGKKAFDALVAFKEEPAHIKSRNGLFNNMVFAAYNTGDYDMVTALEKQILDGSMGTDTSNYVFLSNAYIKKKDIAKASEVLGAAKAKFPNYHQFYLTDMDLAMEANDYDKVARILDEAKVKFPERRSEFILAEVNLYLQRNENEKAIEAMNVAVQSLEGQNEILKVLYQNIAVIYGQLSDKATAPEQVEVARDYRRKALEAATKAHEIDPADINLITQLGNIYIAIGRDYDNEANMMSDTGGKYKELKAKAKTEYLSAIQWLEKSYENKKDDFTKKQLITLYNITEQPDKAKALQGS